jgi:hypothetical protein
MFDFHYDVMMARYGPEKLKLLMTDTDSLVYCVETPDLYADLATMQHHFDFSDYSKTHPLHSTANKKAVGYFKDEMNGHVIERFAGLRAKMYGIQVEDFDHSRAIGKLLKAGVPQEEIDRRLAAGQFKDWLNECKGKGVARGVIKALTVADYEQVRDSVQSTHAVQTALRSYNHAVHTIRFNKVCLSAFDSKRWVCDDGIATLAHGHWRIPRE